MSSHSFRHPVRNSPAASLGYKAVPLSAIGYERSPCLRRPDTGRECSLAWWDKNNDYCGNCAIRGIGRADCYDPKTYVPIELPESKVPGKLEMKPCAYPNCPKKVKGEYCGMHRSRVENRIKQWERKHPGTEAPESFLHRKVQRNPNYIPKGPIKYHPKDAPYKPITHYYDKLETSKKLGFECYHDAAKTLYEKHQSRGKVAELFGISSNGIGNFLKRIGVKMRPPGFPEGAKRGKAK